MDKPDRDETARRANEPRTDRDATPTDPADVNPPRTTTGPITAPKFGSAGSGGAELEPGPGKP